MKFDEFIDDLSYDFEKLQELPSFCVEHSGLLEDCIRFLVAAFRRMQEVGE